MLHIEVKGGTGVADTNTYIAVTCREGQFGMKINVPLKADANKTDDNALAAVKALLPDNFEGVMGAKFITEEEYNAEYDDTEDDDESDT